MKLPFFRSAKVNENQIQTHFIGSKEIVAVKGTISDVADKDDAWYFELCKSAKTVYDIGCNIGYTAILAYLSGEKQRIVLVDPNPKALSVAARNAILNGFISKCILYNSFVSDSSGDKIVLHSVDYGAAGSIYKSHTQTASSKNSTIDSNSITLDSIVQETEVIPELVKIDVEGAEFKVLNGAKGLASKARTMFFVEMHSNEELPMIENAEKVLSWCNEVGYKVLYLKEMKLIEDSNVIAHRGRCHLLLLPKRLDVPENLRSIKQGDSIKFNNY